MERVLREIIDILGDFEGGQIGINFYKKEIWIDVYENSISIIINTGKKYCYLDCETANHKLTKDMVLELAQIMDIVDKNMDLFVEITSK